MHPIEWLRAVARSDDAPHGELASEAASALAALADDSGDLLLSCRRLLDRHPDVGALWWTCARMIAAGDPVAEARAIRDDLRSDQVGLSLALDVPDDATVAVVGAPDLVGELAARRGDLRILTVDETGRTRAGDADDVVAIPAVHIGAMIVASDLVLVSAWAMSGERILAPPGSLAAAVLAHQAPHGVATERSPDANPDVWLTVGVGRRLPSALFEAMRHRLLPDGGDPSLACADLLNSAVTDRVIEPVRVACPVPPELLKPDSPA